MELNATLLNDNEFVKDVTTRIPIWLTEGQDELSDNRSVWDWLKDNIRTLAIQQSKRIARERNEKENNLQNKYAKAKQMFQMNPSHANAHDVKSAKEEMDLIYEEKKKELSSALELGGINMVREAQNIFSI